ncbi:MAG TPA: hypothetical protein VFN02_12785 [Ktedonobacteraceae bacterium]|jgi:hypothetical protein|nr:hypothetical protein [Ktedonobacteraceae bacterium]
MSNRYEREIEEILRNLEQTEPKSGLGQKLSGRFRRKSKYRTPTRKTGLPSIHFSLSEWFLLIAVVAALIAGGYAYELGEPTLVTGVVALVGALCLVLVVLSSFFRSNRSTQSTRYGNVAPLRRNPLSSIKTRWNLFLLKLRYRRGKQ